MYEDAQKMLKNIRNDKSLTCKGVLAFYHAQSDGDDITLYDNDGVAMHTLYGLRQQVRFLLKSKRKGNSRTYDCLDYFSSMKC